MRSLKRGEADKRLGWRTRYAQSDGFRAPSARVQVTAEETTSELVELSVWVLLSFSSPTRGKRYLVEEGLISFGQSEVRNEKVGV